MVINMDFKRYSELAITERRQLFTFVTSLGGRSDFKCVDEMDSVYSGPLFDQGSLHFSYWKKGDFIASVGVIAKEAEWKGELYITDLIVPEANIKYFPVLLKDVFKATEDLPHQTVKLGIRTAQMYLIPLAIELGFTQYARAINMLLSNITLASQSSLRFQPAEPDEYVCLHNDAFRASPNSGLISEADFYESIEKGVDLFIGYKEEEPVSILNIRLKDEIGVIDAVGVSPLHRGKGYGRATLIEGLNRLTKMGAKSFKLLVFSSNKEAYSLYRSFGFIEESTVGYWFECGKCRLSRPRWYFHRYLTT